MLQGYHIRTNIIRRILSFTDCTRGKAGGRPFFYHPYTVYLFAQRFGGYVTAALFGAGDQIVRRALPVHDQRNEIYSFSAVDYSDLQSVSDARRASF